MSKAQDRLVVVVDHGGRQFIGKNIAETDEVVELKDHLKYVEQAIPVQGGQSQVQLQFSPPSHLFTIDTIKLKWLSIEEVSDQKMISSYEKFFTQIRAARSGLVQATQMPQATPKGIQVAAR